MAVDGERLQTLWEGMVFVCILHYINLIVPSFEKLWAIRMVVFPMPCYHLSSLVGQAEVWGLAQGHAVSFSAHCWVNAIGLVKPNAFR